MAQNDRELAVILKFLLDKSSLAQVKQGTSSVAIELEKQYAILQKNKQSWKSISEDAKNYERSATKAFVTSTALIAGTFAYANKYVAKLEETDPLFKSWNKNSKSIESSQERIAKVAATQMLPVYERASKFVAGIANFVEKNPEVVKAAIDTGILIAGFSALAIAASKGIKFVADISYITTTATQMLAAKTMQDAANKQLIASTKMSSGEIAQSLRKSFGIGTAATGTAAASTTVAATVATTLAVIASGVVIGTVIYDIIAKKFGLTRVNQIATGGAYLAARGATGGLGEKLGIFSPEDAEARAIKFAATIGKLTGAIDENSPLWVKATELAKKSATNMNEAIASLKGSEFEKEIVNSFIRMKEDSKKASEEYNNNVAEIEKQYYGLRENENKRYQERVSSIEKSYHDQINSISANYLKQSKQAEESYAAQRQTIIRDSGIEIQRMEENLQNRLMELRTQHEEKVGDLVAKRDALGFVKEMRSYEKARNEEIKNTNIEIRRRREDLAIRLQDLAESHNRERKMRLAEYKQQLKDAAQKRDEQLKMEKEAHIKQLSDLNEAKKNELSALRTKYQQESEQRRQAFIAMVRDLNSALLGERNMKNAYYQAMLKDAQAFLSNYRLALSGGSAFSGSNLSGGTSSGKGAKGSNQISNRAVGGYMFKNYNYNVGENESEFVLRGTTTKQAEQIIGTKLSQRNIIERMQQNKQIVFSPRIDGRVSAAEYKAMQESFFMKIEELFS